MFLQKEDFIINIDQTDFLIPTSSFIVGMGLVMGLSGNCFEYNESSSVMEADIRAISSDWNNVGYDINNALNEEFENLELG